MSENPGAVRRTETYVIHSTVYPSEIQHQNPDMPTSGSFHISLRFMLGNNRDPQYGPREIVSRVAGPAMTTMPMKHHPPIKATNIAPVLRSSFRKSTLNVCRAIIKVLIRQMSETAQILRKRNSPSSCTNIGRHLDYTLCGTEITEINRHLIHPSRVHDGTNG